MMNRSQNDPRRGAAWSSAHLPVRRARVRTQLKVLTFSAAVIGIAMLSACTVDPVDQSTDLSETESPTTSEASTKPAPVQPEPSVDTRGLVGQVLLQKTTLEEMDAMSVSDWAKLDFADRFAWGYEHIGRSYNIISVDITEADFEVIPSLMWEHAFSISTNDADPDVRAKLAGAYRYYTTEKVHGEISPSYQQTIDSVVQNGGEGLGADIEFEASDHGSLQHGTDRDGNPIDFFNVTYNSGPEATYESSPERTSQAIRTPVQLLTGETILFYAIGYGIEGRQSPDDKYPY
jgi:hypothetical protein